MSSFIPAYCVGKEVTDKKDAQRLKRAENRNAKVAVVDGTVEVDRLVAPVQEFYICQVADGPEYSCV